MGNDRGPKSSDLPAARPNAGLLVNENTYGAPKQYPVGQATSQKNEKETRTGIPTAKYLTLVVPMSSIHERQPCDAADAGWGSHHIVV